LPKPMPAGDMRIAAESPVPDRGTICGLPAELSVTESIADRLPAALGVKVMLKVHEPPAISELPQVLVSEKSPLLVPVSEIPVIVSVPVPVLVSVMEPAALLVPTTWPGNTSDVGAKVTAGAIPVPTRGKLCGLSAPLSVTDSVPFCTPVAVGVKLT
jgi:hypothetical protein